MKIFDFIFISFFIITTGVFFGVFIFHLMKENVTSSAIFGALFMVALLFSIKNIIDSSITDNRVNK